MAARSTSERGIGKGYGTGRGEGRIGSVAPYGGGGVIRTREGWIRPLTAFEAVPFVRSGTPPGRV
jgi:hypothetical protein